MLKLKNVQLCKTVLSKATKTIIEFRDFKQYYQMILKQIFKVLNLSHFNFLRNTTICFSFHTI